MTVEQGFSVEVEHRVNAAPDVVFEYFVDPDKYRQWQGIEANLDPRPGGLYEISLAPGSFIRGEYLTVERPRRVVMTWGFEGTTFELPRGLAQVPPGSSTVEFSFLADGDGTIIRMRHTGFPTAEAVQAHQLGWDAYLTRLVALMNGEDPGRDPVVKLTATLYELDAKA